MPEPASRVDTGLGFRSLLVQAVEGAAGELQTELAIRLASQWRAGLIGVSAALPHRPSDTYSGLVLTSVQQSEADYVRQRLQATGERFLKIARERGVRAEWRCVINFPAWALCDAATAADAVVIGRSDTQEGEGIYQSVAIGDLLMGVGRPVILLPEETKALSLATLLVAWKGGREGRRMLADGLPLMRQAKRVLLVHVWEPLTDAGTLGDALRYLQERGVPADSYISNANGGSVPDALLREAEDLGADAILAGAYGHSRLREWCFGGVTRTLIKDCRLPCVLSH